MPSSNNRKFKVTYQYGNGTIAQQDLVKVSHYTANGGQVQFYDAQGQRSDYFSNVISVVEQL